MMKAKSSDNKRTGRIKIRNRVVPKRFQKFEYEGEFRFGDMHGKGKATFKDGKVYEG